MQPQILHCEVERKQPIQKLHFLMQFLNREDVARVPCYVLHSPRHTSYVCCSMCSFKASNKPSKTGGLIPCRENVCVERIGGHWCKLRPGTGLGLGSVEKRPRTASMAGLGRTRGSGQGKRGFLSTADSIVNRGLDCQPRTHTVYSQSLPISFFPRHSPNEGPWPWPCPWPWPMDRGHWALPIGPSALAHGPHVPGPI